MKTRLLVSFVLALFVAVASIPARVIAQPAQTDPVKEVARQRYNEGVKAFDAGKFEDARLAFSQAYQLTQSAGVLFNLGMAEVRTNRCIEGGNHLFQFMREYKEASPEQKATAIITIEDCKKKAALVSVVVDTSGAEVSVDGTLVGKAPLQDPVFVEPGTRTVVATNAGKSAMAKVDAKKGQVVQALVQVNPSAPPPVEPGPAPGPSPGPVQPGPGPVQPGPGPTTGPGPIQPMPPPQQPDTSSEYGFGDWFVSRPLAWVGTGLFAVGLGLGIGFTVASAQSSSDVDEIARVIRDKAEEDNLGRAPCGPEDSTGSQDADGYRGACNQLRDALSVHDANVAVAVVGWVLAGLAAGGTITYIVIDYPASKKKADERTPPPPSVSVAPLVSPSAQGVTVMGTF